MEQFKFKKMVNLLEKYKIKFFKSKMVKDLDAAAAAAKKFGFPVVLKVISKDIIHKSDVGGVVTGIMDEKKVKEGFLKIMKNIKRKVPKAKIEGVLVQKQCKGEEIIIGMKRDKQFGPVIMFGLGGIFVEVMKDVVFRICPVDRKMAIEMVNEIKAAPVLKGFRGKKKINIDAVVDIITKISKIAMDKKKILEIDLNPIIVDEKNANVVDVRMAG